MIGTDPFKSAVAKLSFLLFSLLHGQAGQPAFMLAAEAIEEREPLFRRYLDATSFRVRRQVSAALFKCAKQSPTFVGQFGSAVVLVTGCATLALAPRARRTDFRLFGSTRAREGVHAGASDFVFAASTTAWCAAVFFLAGKFLAGQIGIIEFVLFRHGIFLRSIMPSVVPA